MRNLLWRGFPLSNAGIKGDYVEFFIQESNCDKLESVDFFEIVSCQNITMLKPNGCKIGLTELTADWSSEDFIIIDEGASTEATTEISNDNTSEASNSNTEASDESGWSLVDVLEETSQDRIKHNPQICINGVWFHKSTVLKQTFVGCRVSKDRLRRVQGMSKYVCEKEKQLNLDDVLFSGRCCIISGEENTEIGIRDKDTQGWQEGEVAKWG